MVGRGWPNTIRDNVFLVIMSGFCLCILEFIFNFECNNDPNMPPLGPCVVMLDFSLALILAFSFFNLAIFRFFVSRTPPLPPLPPLLLATASQPKCACLGQAQAHLAARLWQGGGGGGGGLFCCQEMLDIWFTIERG